MGTKLGRTVSRKPAKKVSGSNAKLKKLDELKKVNKEINDRFKVSEKLFVKRQKLKDQLGIE